jgi:diguanylate cyclase (GGDEF)-like protein
MAGVVWLALPLCGMAAVATLDLISRDGSAAGQVFLCYLTLYAASQLRRSGAYVVAAAAVAADAVIVFSLLGFQPALTDFCYVTATLLAMTALLVRGAEVQERLVDALRAQAAFDPLTGLVTRRVLDEAAELAVASAADGSGTALVLIDIDRFKAINDTHGHPVGDAVLVHVAATLVANTRPNSVSCRMGGDELAILLPECAGPAALVRAQHLLDAIRATPLELSDGTLLAVSVNMGVAHMPSHADGIHALYQAADAAPYGRQAKRARGGRSG